MLRSPNNNLSEDNLCSRPALQQSQLMVDTHGYPRLNVPTLCRLSYRKVGGMHDNMVQPWNATAAADLSPLPGEGALYGHDQNLEIQHALLFGSI